MDWSFGSSIRVPAFQAISPEFKPQYHKEREGEGKGEERTHRERSCVWYLTPIIPVTQEADVRRIVLQGQLSKKLARPHLNQ
jgi:hypothetical protein